MKKLFLMICMAVMIGLTACADGRPIPFEQLPANAQTIITQNFVKENILFVALDSEIFSTEYEVKFNDGKELKFNGSGELIKVDCKYEPVPEALIPAEVLTQVRSSYPNAFIKEWKLDDGRWKAELNNGLELIFNKRYQLVGIDD
ncbi:MAG: PepSY-like domain-containing protein [Bacteroidales bacterium]|nr:PepSY-like domain-containing protein [Bacteroidales bacterium]